MALSYLISQSLINFLFLLQIFHKMLSIVHKCKLLVCLFFSLISFFHFRALLFDQYWRLWILSLWQEVQLVMLWCFCFKSQSIIFSSKSNFVYQIWPYYLDIAILLYLNIIVMRRNLLYLITRDSRLQIDNICFLQCSFMTLLVLWVVLTCMRHYTVTLAIGNCVVFISYSIILECWFAIISCKGRIRQLSSKSIEFFNIFLSYLDLFLIIFFKLVQSFYLFFEIFISILFNWFLLLFIVKFSLLIPIIIKIILKMMTFYWFFLIKIRRSMNKPLFLLINHLFSKSPIFIPILHPLQPFFIISSTIALLPRKYLKHTRLLIS